MSRKTTADHISILNREMGEVKTKLDSIDDELCEMKEKIKSLSRLVVVGILVPIALFVVQKMWGG